jgi:hypothetical protein
VRRNRPLGGAYPRLHPTVVLTAIATSKSTVLGLRLDHDRRAWVEAAAAQAGLTVRGFFEGLIDRARIETSGALSGASIDVPDAGGGGPRPGSGPVLAHDDEGDQAAGGEAAGGETAGGETAGGETAGGETAGGETGTGEAAAGAAAAGAAGTTPPRVATERDVPPLPPIAEVPRLLLVPGQVLEAATSATATLIESGGRCLRETWRAFLVTLLEGMHDSDA